MCRQSIIIIQHSYNTSIQPWGLSSSSPSPLWWRCSAWPPPGGWLTKTWTSWRRKRRSRSLVNFWTWRRRDSVLSAPASTPSGARPTSIWGTRVRPAPAQIRATCLATPIAAISGRPEAGGDAYRRWPASLGFFLERPRDLEHSEARLTLIFEVWGDPEACWMYHLFRSYIRCFTC